MRKLKYILELPDGSQKDESTLDFAQAGNLLRSTDWQALRSDPGKADQQSESPFMLFLDEGDSFFMILPDEDGLLVTARVIDKWNLFGLMSKEKAFTLNFGLREIDDTLNLLKLFFEDNYPSLRALEKEF